MCDHYGLDFCSHSKLCHHHHLSLSLSVSLTQTEALCAYKQAYDPVWPAVLWEFDQRSLTAYIVFVLFSFTDVTFIIMSTNRYMYFNAFLSLSLSLFSWRLPASLSDPKGALSAQRTQRRYVCEMRVTLIRLNPFSSHTDAVHNNIRITASRRPQEPQNSCSLVQRLKEQIAPKLANKWGALCSSDGEMNNSSINCPS